MDDLKKNNSNLDENSKKDVDGEVEFIDATNDDVIEIIDSFGSDEVIEVSVGKKAEKERASEHLSGAKDINLDDLYGSHTVIVKKAEPKKDDKPKEEKKEGAPKPPEPKAPGGKSAGPSRSAVNPLFASNDDDGDDPLKMNFSDYEKPKFKPTPKMIGIAAAALVALIIIIILMQPKDDKVINLNDYASVVFTGFSGQGKAEVQLNYDKIQKDYGDKIKVTAVGKNVADLVNDCFKYTVTPDSGLSKGDRVTVSWNLDKDRFIRNSDGEITASEMSVKNSSLKDAENIDPFEGFMISFEGRTGEGKATVSAPANDKLGALKFVLDKSENLKLGEEVTVSLTAEGYENVADYFAENGFIAATTEKKITVSGLTDFDAVDLFANVSVVFTGLDGLGNAVLNASAGTVTGVKYELVAAEKLSNDDKVVVKAVSDSDKSLEAVLHEQGLGLGETEKEFIVAGLSIPDVYDPFADLEFVYNGIAPNGTVSVKADNVKVPGLTFTLDKNSGLSNGDSIVVTVATPDGSDPAERCLLSGKKLSETQKTIQASGLSYYVNDKSQIGAALINTADGVSRAIMDDVAKGVIASESIKAITYDGFYIQYPKSNNVELAYNPSFGGEIHNRFYMIYKVLINDGASEFTYFWPIEFANLVGLPSGEIVFNSNEYIAGLNDFDVNGKAYYGYQDINDFVAGCLDSASTTYDYQNGN